MCAWNDCSPAVMSPRAISCGSSSSSVRARWARMRALASCAIRAVPSVRLCSISAAANRVATPIHVIAINTQTAATTRPRLNCRLVRRARIHDPTAVPISRSDSSTMLTVETDATLRWPASTAARSRARICSAPGREFRLHQRRRLAQIRRADRKSLKVVGASGLDLTRVGRELGR